MSNPNEFFEAKDLYTNTAGRIHIYFNHVLFFAWFCCFSPFFKKKNYIVLFELVDCIQMDME